MQTDLIATYAQHEAAFTGCDVPPAQYVPSTVNHFPTSEKLVGDEIDRMFPPVATPIHKLLITQSASEPEKLLDLAKDVYFNSFIQPHKERVAYIHALSVWIAALLKAARDAEKIGGAQTYCAYQDALRFVLHIASREETIIAARETLNDLFLAQTASTPEMWWKDAYTGEVDAESEDELDTNVLGQELLTSPKLFDELVAKIQASAVARRNKIAQRDGPKKAADLPTSENSTALRLVEVYGMAEYNGVLMSTLALKAASGSLSDDDLVTEVDADDDRGFVPPTLEKSFDPDSSMLSRIKWEDVNKYRALKKACWSKANDLYPELGRDAKYADVQAQRNMRMQEFRKQFLASGDFEDLPCTDIKKVPARQNLMDYTRHLMREDIQAAAYVIYPFVLDPDEGEVLKVTDVDFLASELPGDLLDCIELYEEEISERSGSMRKSTDPEVESVDKYCATYFEQLGRTMPRRDTNPTATAVWQVAYTSAIAAGSTQEQAQGTAWAAFRQEVSPAGANAYEVEFQKSHDGKKAMSAFWKLAPGAPRKKAEITHIKGDGTGVKIAEPADKPAWKSLPPLKAVIDGEELVIADPEGFDNQPAATPEPVIRDITWYVADMKLKAGEIDLSKKDKLIQVLNEKKFTHARYFLDHLAAGR